MGHGDVFSHLIVSCSEPSPSRVFAVKSDKPTLATSECFWKRSLNRKKSDLTQSNVRLSPCHNHQVQRWNFRAPCNATFIALQVARKIAVTWPLYLLNLRSKNRKKLCLLVFLGDVIPVVHSVLASMFIHTRKGSFSFNNR